MDEFLNYEKTIKIRKGFLSAMFAKDIFVKVYFTDTLLKLVYLL